VMAISHYVKPSEGRKSALDIPVMVRAFPMCWAGAPWLIAYDEESVVRYMKEGGRVFA